MFTDKESRSVKLMYIRWLSLHNLVFSFSCLFEWIKCICTYLSLFPLLSQSGSSVSVHTLAFSFFCLRVDRVYLYIPQPFPSPASEWIECICTYPSLFPFLPQSGSSVSVHTLAFSLSCLRVDRVCLYIPQPFPSPASEWIVCVTVLGSYHSALSVVHQFWIFSETSHLECMLVPLPSVGDEKKDKISHILLLCFRKNNKSSQRSICQHLIFVHQLQVVCGGGEGAHKTRQTPPIDAHDNLCSPPKVLYASSFGIAKCIFL